ncbi:endo-1,4-beta-xylanase [Mobilitalea sibirica]|uniref:Beta-xylanase n=1 Tax=Mobilitalea sibirica TaxID=1462919 RepID=A0A8J7HBI7_9FIRM|nr:endo-1,4-beta-xylanase [Mobilitalea sibirica]MBH1939274.1 endo-1,4-beta-xylanase [Mobilitalea sibirica]
MHKIKKMIVLIMILLIAITVLAGCKADDKNNTATPTPTAVPAEEPAPTEAPEATPTATPTPVPIDYKNAVVKDIYADYFTVGAVLNGSGVGNAELKELVLTHFNSLTMENEMKPDAILDYHTSISDPKYNESPAVKFNAAEGGIKFAKENGLKMRGHTLIWHSQTPRWFFAEGYSMKHDAPLVSKEVMLKRMENYIKQVLEYYQTNYPGVIYAWDVVNEAINPGEGHPDGLRVESYWYRTIGDEYIEKAFEYARKYADPDVKLFYNDYNTEETPKVVAITKLVKKIKEQGNIDGIGMQTHVKVDAPSLTDIDASVRAYAELDVELQVTELDVDLKGNTEEDIMKQATRYKRMFLYFKKWRDEGVNLTNVTFWGTIDGRSWLNKANEPSYPLLFDDNLEKKPAYFGVIQDPDIPLY